MYLHSSSSSSSVRVLQAKVSIRQQKFVSFITRLVGHVTLTSLTVSALRKRSSFVARCLDRHEGLKIATCLAVYAQTNIGLLWRVGSGSNTAEALHITCYTKYTAYGRWSFPAALASTARPTANKTATEIFWFIMKWSHNLFCQCFQTLLPSGEFSGIVSAALLCQWKGENGFLFLFKKREETCKYFFPKLVLYVTQFIQRICSRLEMQSIPFLQLAVCVARARACVCVCVCVCVCERESGRPKYRYNVECSPQRDDKNSYIFVTWKERTLQSKVRLGQAGSLPLNQWNDIKTLQLQTCFRVVEAGNCTGLLCRLVG
jgi:hypothetical protein